MSTKKVDPESQETPPVVVTPVEEKQVEERVALSANVVYETIRREGDEELLRPSIALAWSGLAAGLSMGFSLVAEALLVAYLPDMPWRPLVSKLGYSVGFLIVVLGRQQLFTENTLTVILPLLLRKSMKTLVRVLRLWGVVLTSNLVGTFLFALCIAKIHMFDPPVESAFAALGRETIVSGFGAVLIRAVFAGWLIALMVWLLPAAESARVSIIIIITYLIGLGHFAHVIAGSTKAFYLVATGALSWWRYFEAFFVPTLIGNILGGVSLVAALGHAQVVAGNEN